MTTDSDQAEVVVHLRFMVDSETGDVLPLCQKGVVTKDHSSLWMNDVTCDACRDIWHKAIEAPR